MFPRVLHSTSSMNCADKNRQPTTSESVVSGAAHEKCGGTTEGGNGATADGRAQKGESAPRIVGPHACSHHGVRPEIRPGGAALPSPLFAHWQEPATVFPRLLYYGAPALCAHRSVGHIALRALLSLNCFLHIWRVSLFSSTFVHLIHPHHASARPHSAARPPRSPPPQQRVVQHLGRPRHENGSASIAAGPPALETMKLPRSPSHCMQPVGRSRRRRRRRRQ